MLGENKHFKTGVINDPLGQPTVPVGSDYRLILQFLGRTYGRTLCVKIVITTGRVWVGLMDQYTVLVRDRMYLKTENDLYSLSVENSFRVKCAAIECLKLLRAALKKTERGKNCVNSSSILKQTSFTGLRCGTSFLSSQLLSSFRGEQVL